MKIIADSHIPYIKEYFGQSGDLVLKPGRFMAAEDIKDADILLVRSVTAVDASLLANSRVKFVGSVTAGADHLDTLWMDQAGIRWSVASGFNAPPVADYVVSAIAALQKNDFLTQERLRAAVIGVGNVGRLVVDRLKLLGFEVVLCDPLRAKTESGFNSTSIDEINDVDLISLHVPLTRIGEDATYHLINEAFLKRQKSGTILLNASRGAVVDTEALIRAGQHMHWCFDVFEDEPNINKYLLERALIATPHIAGYSVQSKIRGVEKIFRLACAQNVIKTPAITPVEMPLQSLNFTESELSWHDVVLGVFNPLVISAMLRTVLLPTKDHGELFDEMRHQFNYRNEFAFTRVSGLAIPEKERKLLQQLGLRLMY